MSKQITIKDTQQTIEEVECGTTGFVIPWAFECDLDGKLYINTRYTIHKNSFGTSTIQIVKGKGVVYMTESYLYLLKIEQKLGKKPYVSLEKGYLPVHLLE